MSLDTKKGRVLDVGKAAGVDISGANATVGEVAAPKTFFSVAPPVKTGTMANVALIPTSPAYPAGYHAGNPGGLPAIDPDLNPANILAGIVIFGVTGTAFLYNRFFPEWFSSSKALAVVPVDKTIGKNAGLTRSYVGVYDSSPGDMVYTNKPVFASAKSADVIHVDQSVPPKNAPFTSGFEAVMVVDGGVAHDDPVDTDDTAHAQSAAANDMPLLPAAPLVLDAYGFGGTSMFDAVDLNIGTAGIGVWTIVAKYWNGAAWFPLAGVVDGTVGFTLSGTHRISFTRPVADWALKNIATHNLYWIWMEVTIITPPITTQPKGTQAWLVKTS